MPLTLDGVFAPLATPFDDADQLDVGRWRAALRHWIGTPLSGFIVLGSNGEAGVVDDGEADIIVEEARSIIPASKPLIVGAGLSGLGEGQKVSYDLESGRDGKVSATNLQTL